MRRGRVVVTGAFDGLHPGHDAFLSQARQLGGELVAIVATDAIVRRYKHRSPQWSQTKRLLAVRRHPLVAHARLGSVSGDYLSPIVALAPSVVALGYDQWPDDALLRRELDARGLVGTRIVRLAPYRPAEFHSSIIQQLDR
jgi:FAD synthetase